MLTLADSFFSVDSREFRILSALLRAGRLALPVLDDAERLKAVNGEAGPALAKVLHSQLSLESLGFVYSREAILTMSWMHEADIVFVHANLVSMLTRALGAHNQYAPLYPNFPQQVLAASDSELLVNAFMHYLGDWFGVRILPKYVEAARSPLKMLESTKPTTLAVAQDAEVYQLFIRLVDGNASMSPANKVVVLSLLSYFSEFYPGRLLEVLSSATIPQKENRALVGGWLLQNSPVAFEAAEFKRLFQTPTDILRLAVALGAADLASADLALGAPPRFGKMTRGMRRQVLSLLDALAAESVLPEMFQRREQWVRLGEVLHPGEYKERFKRTNGHFKALRSNDAPASWQGAVEASIAHRETTSALELLKQRPGVLARKMHEVLRKAPTAADKAEVLHVFGKVVGDVSTPVLVQLAHRMSVDLANIAVQAFSPKGGAGRMWVPNSAVEPLDSAHAYSVRNLVGVELARRFGKLPQMGKVFIDPALRDFTVPFGQRTSQKALHTLARGSRVDLGDTNILRAFLWWNESGVDKAGNPLNISRVDLDLSCTVLDESFEFMTHCSFTQLREEGLTHSGDITSAPHGACEFIDIDFSALPQGAAYVGLLAFAYTNQDFAELPEAYVGWLARADGPSGDIYDARTVKQKVDLTAKGQRVLMGYIDVRRRQFVWADLVLPALCAPYNAVETSTIMTGVLARGIVNPVRPTLGQLLREHVDARGELVETAQEADIVFTSRLPQSVTPARADQVVVTAYDAEVIIADYLI